MKKLTGKLKAFTKTVKREVSIYRRVMQDERVPLTAKILLWLAIGYLLLPFDIIPDIIPVFGQLDDIIIVPALIYFALKLIPVGIIDEYRSIIN
ncbi:MAG: DUF1232 domain-containing protein [Ignavibacteria bacterium]